MATFERNSHYSIIPVLILNVTEEEANLILATHDPLANMAQIDAEIAISLMEGPLATQRPSLPQHELVDSQVALDHSPPTPEEVKRLDHKVSGHSNSSHGATVIVTRN